MTIENHYREIQKRVALSGSMTMGERRYLAKYDPEVAAGRVRRMGEAAPTGPGYTALEDTNGYVRARGGRSFGFHVNTDAENRQELAEAQTQGRLAYQEALITKTRSGVPLTSKEEDYLATSMSGGSGGGGYGNQSGNRTHDALPGQEVPLAGSPTGITYHGQEFIRTADGGNSAGVTVPGSSTVPTVVTTAGKTDSAVDAVLANRGNIKPRKALEGPKYTFDPKLGKKNYPDVLPSPSDRIDPISDQVPMVAVPESVFPSQQPTRLDGHPDIIPLSNGVDQYGLSPDDERKSLFEFTLAKQNEVLRNSLTSANRTRRSVFGAAGAVASILKRTGIMGDTFDRGADFLLKNTEDPYGLSDFLPTRARD